MEDRLTEKGRVRLKRTLQETIKQDLDVNALFFLKFWFMIKNDGIIDACIQPGMDPRDVEGKDQLCKTIHTHTHIQISLLSFF